MSEYKFDLSFYTLGDHMRLLTLMAKMASGDSLALVRMTRFADSFFDGDMCMLMADELQPALEAFNGEVIKKMGWEDK